ncbi:MAG: ADP-ribosylglycohydrolase family protein [Candidatus Sericytochromatia bacterium]|nr:ADP-ribosylglycohydrolase family protein [Candidatus Sericytochromatia bacterium]
MSQPAHTLVQASLLADALALPAHWCYDQGAIASQWGRLADLQAPPAGSYHAAQPLGGHTHYGAQALLLLEAVAAAGGRFEATAWAEAWRAYWAGEPTSYVDGATRQTLANLAAGAAPLAAGSPSSDWGGAARGAAVVAATLDAPEDVAVAAARAQTEVTHRDPLVAEGAAFWTRAVRAVASGQAVPDALAAAAEAGYTALPAQAMLAAAREAAMRGAEAAVASLGAACGISGALPATMAVALAHPADLEGALIANVMAGGDSAARGLALGMLLGAAPGVRLPDRWLAAWAARPRAEAALAWLGA